MKKILLILVLLVSSFFVLAEVSTADCSTFNSESSLSISDSINSCLSNSKVLVQANNWNLKINDWLKTTLMRWIIKIASLLWLLAVWALVYAAFLFTMSAWEDEKIKKAKDITKRAILWFIWVIWASSLIAILINVMYSVK